MGWRRLTARQLVNTCRATIPSTTAALIVAPSIRPVVQCALAVAIRSRAASRNSISRRHLWRSVADPVARTINGNVTSSPHNPMPGRAEYQFTICCAACAGSYCGGCRLRTKSAAMKSKAGRMRSSSAVAVASLGKRITTLYCKVATFATGLRTSSNG
jgi:hypothetical protein